MFKCSDGNCPRNDTLEICCNFCPDIDACEDACGKNPDDCGNCSEVDAEATMIDFQRQQIKILQSMKAIVAQKKHLEEMEKTLKDMLRDAMEKNGIKKVETPDLNITYVAATNASTIDGAKLKKKYPAIAAECSKSTPRSAYVKVEWKGGEKQSS